MLNVGIIGAAGYTGGELIRILLNHPDCALNLIHSHSQAEKKVSDIHEDLIGETSLLFTSDLRLDVDVLFLCMGHGESEKFLASNTIPEKVFLIDLSEDFRLKISSTREFIYGLPELNRNSIKSARNVANPGCFATAIQLALLPMAHSKLLRDDVHVSAITGSTGAGKSLTSTTHYTWRSANISLYNPFQHRHLNEIKKTVGLLQPEWKNDIRFIPFRGNFTRGIFAACYTKSDLNLNEIRLLYENYYSEHPFVLISDKNPSLKAVINSNNCILYLEKHGDTILIISMIDNLIKGASGQAVQNMNLMVGLNESCGLKLKSIGI